MHINVYVHLAGLDEMKELQDSIGRIEAHIIKEIQMAAGNVQQEMQNLTDKVTDIESVDQSAATLLAGLSQMLRDNANNPQQVRALADRLDQSKQQLAQAVAANTPADPNASGGGTTTTG